MKLIREGLKSSWAECYSREYRVACRRIVQFLINYVFNIEKNDEEFKNAVKTVLVDKKKICYDWKFKNFKDISKDLVESYFRPLEEDLKIPEYKPDIKPHALYPVKVFF